MSITYLYDFYYENSNEPIRVGFNNELSVKELESYIDQEGFHHCSICYNNNVVYDIY